MSLASLTLPFQMPMYSCKVMCAHNHIHADLNSLFCVFVCTYVYKCICMCSYVHMETKDSLGVALSQAPSFSFFFFSNVVVLVWFLFNCSLFQTGSHCLALASLEFHI